MDYGQLLAINIRRIREKRGMTQVELARRSGIASQHIGSIERHEKRPCVKSILKIAAALQVNPADLFKRANFDSTVYVYTVFDEGTPQADGEDLDEAVETMPPDESEE